MAAALPPIIVGHLSTEPRLSERGCVISGATRGFGQAIAVRVLEEGARVVLLARSSFAETLALINSIEGATPEYVAAHTLCLAADIESVAACAAAAAAAAEKFGPAVHALVNNAALFVFHSVETASPADWDRSAAVNIKGHALLTKAFLPAMKVAGAPGGGGASIVWQGSISAFLGQPDCATYSTMKGAIVQMSRNCAYDFACVALGRRGGGRPLRPRNCASTLIPHHPFPPDVISPSLPPARPQQVQHPMQLGGRGDHRDAHLRG
jgi:NAD(P)-dependent dehydrogenase (short-subunit alcohol dehydrogenase family)